MEHTSRHLRFKLQSLNRRLDDLEEATRNLQKAEDEVLELQEKIVQVEGNNSSMLADIDALRKRVVKIEGKDEEVKKAEDLCRIVREKLENEENVTRELRSEIEILQKKMTELEKLEEAFSKSKNDCTQLCLSLNEEKNMSRKLTSELETLRARIRELESSESKLDKAEEFLTSELEKIRSLAVGFANERKYFLEKEKQNEKIIQELKQQLKGKKNIGDQTQNESNVLQRSSDQLLEHNKIRIEDNVISKLSQGVGFDYIKSENQTTSENERNKQQEDNKIHDLCQEIENLKSQIKRFEGIDEELKQFREKNRKLQEIFLGEQNKARHLDGELKELKRQVSQQNEVENGVIGSDELSLHNKSKNERANKSKGVIPEPPASKYTQRDLSPKQLRKERHRDIDVDISSKRHLSSTSTNSKRPLKPTLSDMTLSHSRKSEDRLTSNVSAAKEFGALHEIKKAKDQPSVLSRYPPAAQEHNTQKTWKASTGNKDVSAKQFGEDYSIKVTQIVDSRKESTSEEDEDLNETPGAKSDKVNSNFHEVQLDDNSSSALHSEPVTSGLEGTSPDKYTAKMVEVQTKTAPNSDSSEVKDISRDRPSRYSRLKSRMDSITNSSDTAQSTKPLSSKDSGNQNLNSNRVSYNRERQRPLSSLKPQIPEKPHISESTENKEWDKRNVTLRIQNRRQSNPKEKTHVLEQRISQFDMDSQQQQRDSLSDISRRTSSDNSESMEKPSRIEIRARSYSPREALQSTVIIKPVIVEKDTKESMGEYRARSSAEQSRSQINTTTNKVTSSITFFPAESPSSRSNTDEIIKQRHTSTSNIRLSANDQPLLNNISIPFEISINKQDMLKLVDTKDNLDHKENSKAFDPGNFKEQMKNNNNSVGLETVLLKSHEIEGNHLDNKSVKVRSSYGRNVFGSTEELDILSNHKDVTVDTKHRRRSAFEDERPGKLHTREMYSRNRNSFENSCTVNETVSKRSSSAGLNSWNRLSTESEYSYSSRRKANNLEKLTKVDTSGSKSLHQQPSMVEERIRRLEQ
ncbi:hypothetical protein XENTR_v10005974 [Xenopus tropicalis]|uniref:Leucine zipper protein 1 n=1 Tax=Xenopus tropicalis TaxID=8364 RepID=A0A8J0QMD7_XENTR|nr:leucine zipper protein 1 [Xenopus tropicalis]XP_017947079.2 leucine zipper protein 1 [Xenopus tropicalis]KAE8624521.1 hypothetical protein XENTR_v10005974 [Xenopus tropicalis]KAE8624522.1 hypothetical protein XENTR_v10005974 [Xenopus tropicalis]